jgi:hypothetical protein
MEARAVDERHRSSICEAAWLDPLGSFVHRRDRASNPSSFSLGFESVSALNSSENFLRWRFVIFNSHEENTPSNWVSTARGQGHLPHPHRKN